MQLQQAMGSAESDSVESVATTSEAIVLRSSAAGGLKRAHSLGSKEKGEEIQVWISYQGQNNFQSKQTTVMRVFPGETIADIKLRVQARKGWFASHQRMTYGDMELEDEKTIGLVAQAAGMEAEGEDGPGEEHSDGKAQGPLHLMVHLSDVLNVRIRTLHGETILPVHAGDTVREIKEALNLLDDHHHLPDQQHVLMNGKMLEDDQRLAHTGILDNAIVHVLIKRTTKVRILPVNGSQFELSISKGETVGSLKRRIEAAEGIPAAAHAVVYNDELLVDDAPLSRYGITKESLLELRPLPATPTAGAAPAEVDTESVRASLERCVQMMKQAQAGLDLGMEPCLASAGTGGAYFLLGPAGNKVAVFKPEDEEPHAMNNPRGLEGRSGSEGLRRGTLPGEGASRELAAFVLDREGFSSVPPTAMVSLKQTSSRKYAAVKLGGAHGKKGSLQVFVPSESDCEEMGVTRFPDHEVHKIALLDIRLANTDRNGSNVLAQRREGGGWSLVPIDHGYCLPGSFSDISFEWISWPQARRPFGPEARRHAASLDVDEDLEALAGHGVALRPECEVVFRVCGMLLRMGIESGLTASDLGNIMCRQTMQQSALEKLSNQALRAVSSDGGRIHGTGRVKLHELRGEARAMYFEKISRLMEEYLKAIADSS